MRLNLLGVDSAIALPSSTMAARLAFFQRKSVIWQSSGKTPMHVKLDVQSGETRPERM